jgi:dTDP-4-dehydrorhamnose reductase
MRKVAIVGGSGMVASRFIDLASKDFKITSLDEKTVDITKRDAVFNFFSKNSFDSIVNFAAFTNVDGAEFQRNDKNGLVWKLNVEGPRNLVEFCKEEDVFLIHISTDFVFPGNEDYPGPYNEDAALPTSSNGIGWYGWTKKIAEDVVSNSATRFAIVRYGYPFRAATYERKLDWGRNLLKLYDEHKLYPLFTDQIQSVLFIDELTRPLTKIIKEELNGIFHIVSSDTTTPYEIGSYLLGKYAGKKVNLQRGSMAEFLRVPGRIPRPRLGGLISLKTQKSLNMKFKSWKEMVDEFIAQLSTS